MNLEIGKTYLFNITDEEIIGDGIFYHIGKSDIGFGYMYDVLLYSEKILQKGNVTRKISSIATWDSLETYIIY